MKSETIKRLKAHYSESPVLCGEPATEDTIVKAQQRLNCCFDQDYIEFLRCFGCGIVGSDPIFGIGITEAMGMDDDVVRQTEHFRKQKWPGVVDGYVISGDGRGNPIVIGPDGKVRLSDHDVGDIPVIADSFEGFLLERL